MILPAIRQSDFVQRRAFLDAPGERKSLRNKPSSDKGGYVEGIYFSCLEALGAGVWERSLFSTAAKPADGLLKTGQRKPADCRVAPSRRYQ